ncbi:hypothetical protein AGABI1DRAFT_54760 [Agaricus bisporus var. burnettii JB137-S8]|uniref:GAR domain-containing protein n=1 Tax=Agaricus bisporus var. burnettii (strain JB137-S8 / ATCC MYA-4627 / FGSC 10392) TaxID=597362 RepID=K5X1T5_AGABU|nr:uncharacterized protein AGABI1DRAFT_54760 [Agaricus bisporus var. burnettii JB137-S8]EKM81776.1 hypothetical protein AGABI1DRAFT_54760 [Agaricus bisporus var. burnettii JB137-S8]
MTELSYAISDIQARTFEIQELRHKPHSSGDSANTSTIIDQSLAAMDEKLDSVANGIKSINDTLDPLLRNSTTPTVSSTATKESNERAALLRKHATLLGDWEAVKKESQVLREELKEDKWLTVFRTVTDQADGMMSSLEKAVNRCQDFIFQFYRKGPEHALSMSQTSLASSRSDKPAITFEVFNSLQDSYEAKKKHYMPATSKVLSIIDKGVQERVTKNGETLRRHAESAQKWRNLRERITRTDAEMENVRRLFLTGDASSEADSSVSSKNGYLATPPSGHRMARAPSSSGVLSGTMSPLRMLRKLTNSSRTSTTPLSINKGKMSRTPSSEPPPNSKKSQKISLSSSTRASDAGPLPATPERPAHKHSQSLTPQTSPRTFTKPEVSSTDKGKGPPRPTWNSSTKVEPEDKSRIARGTPHSRAPSASGNYPDLSTSYRRSLSRASMASSRPWSPINSSSTTPSHLYAPPPLPTFRSPSRPQTPSQNLVATAANTPRPRPKTPSHIPMPKTLRSVSTGAVEGLPMEDDSPLSPSFSNSGMGDSPAFGQPPRPPSRSKIPVPSLQFQTPSRPSTSMSRYGPESPTSRMSPRGQLARAQTPEIGSLGSLRARPMQGSISGSSSGKRSTSRPPIPRLPPSSFRDGQSSRAPSRSASRAGAHTPATSLLIESWLQSGAPTYEYIPVNWKDPLDVEVARVLNSLAHGFKVERLDPPLRKVKEGEEIQAKYSFSTMLGSKNIVLKLTSANKRGEGVKKVMCRVGGGWQDLTDYVLNRQT